MYIGGGSNNYVDCNGGSITGQNISSTFGIYSAGTNTTVQNCNIRQFDYGINLGGSNHLIVNNTATSFTASNSGSLRGYPTNSIIANNSFLGTGIAWWGG